MKLFDRFVILFFFLSLSGLLWTIVFIFLPKTPLFYYRPFINYSDYNTIRLSHLFNLVSFNENGNFYNLSSLKLKAIFTNGNRGFIILQDGEKTFFLELGKNYKGYKLIKIYPNKVILKKHNKLYELEFQHSKINFKNSYMTYNVSREEFLEYRNNLSNIWKNISLIKDKEGYKVTYVKKGSIFDKLGLKKGDILLEVNGIILNNDAEAWNLYKNADKFNTFRVKLLRNNKLKVIDYEVY